VSALLMVVSVMVPAKVVCTFEQTSEGPRAVNIIAVCGVNSLGTERGRKTLQTAGG